MLSKKKIVSNGMASQAFDILVRNSFTYKKTYELLKKSQWWTADQLEEYQLEQLSKLLKHAYTNVPYYTRVFKERGLKPKDIQDIKDLEQLPILTKEMVRANLKELCAKNYSSNRFQRVTTGGSSGTPLELYLERGVTDAKEWAFMKSQWDRVGYKFRDKCAIFRGYKVPVSDNTFWKSQILGRWMLFSSYNINEMSIPYYVGKLKEYNPRFIQAYPSSISLLAKIMNENKIQPLTNTKAILCGSENLFPTQRKMLEDTFKTRVYSWYGLTEKVVLAGECEVSNHYHIFPEYGITELIDENGKIITSGTGEIVGTGFNNYAMPLIRYKTEDIGALSTRHCSCGREYKLFEHIEGRTQDIVLTKENYKITLRGLIFRQHIKAFDHILDFQIAQEKKGEIIFNIVKTNNYTIDHENEIVNKINEVSNGQLDIHFNYVNSIPKTNRGKHKLMIQKLENTAL